MQVKVLQSKPENLVDTFLLLMPTPTHDLATFQKLVDLKVSPQPLPACLSAQQLTVSPASSAATPVLGGQQPVSKSVSM